MEPSMLRFFLMRPLLIGLYSKSCTTLPVPSLERQTASQKDLPECCDGLLTS